MAKDTNTDKGQPSDNRKESGTGIPSNVSDENRKNDDRLTEQYTNDDQIDEGVRTMHPNRNEGKDNATNIGGYRG